MVATPLRTLFSFFFDFFLFSLQKAVGRVIVEIHCSDVYGDGVN